MLHQPNTYLQLNIYCLLYISIGGGTDNIIGLGGGGSGNYSAMADRVCVCVCVCGVYTGRQRLKDIDLFTSYTGLDESFMTCNMHGIGCCKPLKPITQWNKILFVFRYITNNFTDTENMPVELKIRPIFICSL